MQPISDSFAQALTGRHRRAARVTALDSSLVPIPNAVLTGDAGYVIDGSVTIDRNRSIRRTAELVVANPDGVWTPSGFSDFFFFGNILRLERGVYVGSSIEWVTLGTFVIDTPTVAVGVAGSTIRVQMQDTLKRAVYSKFAVPTTYASGARIATVIQQIAVDAGMGAAVGSFGGPNYSFDDAGKTLAAARVFEQQTERVVAMMQIAHDYALELFVDASGILTLRPARSVLEVPVAWEFARGEEAVMLGITKGWSDQRLYNHVVVTGEAADLPTPAFGEAKDLNPSSPAYVNGPLGDRTYFYSSSMIRTNAMAQSVANALLPDVALIEESISLPIVVNPALEAGDGINIVEEVSKTADRYLIDSITIPLGAGSSTISTKKIRSLS